MRRRSSSTTSSDISSDSYPEIPEKTDTSNTPAEDPPNSSSAPGSTMLSEKKRSGKRPGRKPSKIDTKAKLERSRQSARECRARKKLRYQYLEELVLNREQAIFSLRDELETYKQWCIQVDKGIVTDKLLNAIQEKPRVPPSYSRPRQTSTVTTGTPSLFQAQPSRTAAFGHTGRSISLEQGPLVGGSMTQFHPSHHSSQLHGAGAQVHDSGFAFAGSSSMSDLPQAVASSMQMTSSTGGHYHDGHYSEGGSGYNQTQYGGDMNTNYGSPVVTTTASQNYINLNDASYPTTQSDPVATLTSIANPSSILPTYDMAVAYNIQPPSHTNSQQASTSQTEDISPWVSFLADLDSGLARQGAESASGTPQSVDGIRTLPTVIHEMGDTSSDSDT